MIPELQLVILLLIRLVVASRDSVHPEENNHQHDPLNPNMLQCPNTTIEGKDGDTVILPCSTKDKTDISHDQVEWTVKDPNTGEDKNVHTYFQGEDFLHEQRDDFKDRTSLFKEGLLSGNLSLSLLVTTSHSGTYYCSVPGHLRCTLTLKVLPKVKNDTSQKHQDDPESPEKPNNGQTIGGVVGGVLGVAALIAVVVWYRKRLYFRRNANNPQTHQSASYHRAEQPPQDEEKNQWTKTQMKNGSR